MHRTLVERDAHLTILRELMDEARAGHGGLAVVAGPAGIGKTSLLTTAVAADHGLDVLTAQGHELEQAFAFGVAIQLFEGRLARRDDRDELLAGAAAHAEPVLTAGTGASGSGLFAALHGLYWLTAGLAERGPLAIVVDDAHWADEPSLRWLVYLARRVRELPVALIVASRVEEPGAAAMLETLETIPGARAVAPAPLTAAGVAAVAGEADDAFADACLQVTGGNPFLLTELLAEIDRRGADRTVQAAHELHPERITRRVQTRLERLPGDAVRLAEALAVLETGPAARALALADAERGAIDVLTDARLVEQHDGELAFAHPLLRAAVAASLGPFRADELHAGAAELLVADGEPAERAAQHLLALEEARSGHAALLRRAADEALARGAPVQASAFLRRALRAPVDEAARPGLLAACGRAAVPAGEPDAVELFAEAVRTTADPVEAARLTVEAARVSLLVGGAPLVASLALELLAGSPLPSDLDRELRVAVLSASHLDPAVAAGIPERFEDLLPPGHVPRSATERAVLASTGLNRSLTTTGTAEEAVALALAGWDDGRLLDDEGPDGATASFVTGALAAAGRWADDIRVATELLDAARAAGSVVAAATASYVRSVARLHSGDVAGALADADAALEARPYGWTTYAAAGVWIAARAHVELGDLDAARAVLASHDPEADGDMLLNAAYWSGASRVRLAEEDAAGALAASERMRTCMQGLPLPYFGEWQLPAVEALVRLGRAAEAEALAEPLVASTRAWAAPGRVGAALRALALARGGDETLLAEAVEELRASDDLLDLARALIDLGASRRRAGRRGDAAGPLREALDLAGRCGSVWLERLARGELGAAGQFPRRTALRGVDALTPGEHRVCELAAQGLTNRAIAQALFVTVKAVEKHLANAYPKLGVAGKRELAAALAASGRG